MNVIPFDPARRMRGKAAAPWIGASDDLCTLEEHERIAMLERALMNALRENARNWARAQAAESRLATLEEARAAEGLPPVPPPPTPSSTPANSGYPAVRPANDDAVALPFPHLVAEGRPDEPPIPA